MVKFVSISLFYILHLTEFTFLDLRDDKSFLQEDFRGCLATV